MVSPYGGSALRRSAWQFLTGKAISGALTFAIVLVVVRLLPVDQYAAYVTLVAGVELLIVLASCGLPWLAARQIPDHRLHAPASNLRRLLAWLVAAHATMVLLCVAVAAGLLDLYLRWTGLSVFGVAAITYLAVLAVEASGRFARESLLGGLMEQGVARTSLVARQAFLLAGLLFIAWHGQATVDLVARTELAAALVGTALALGGLWRRSRAIGDSATMRPDWQPPGVAPMLRTALDMYGAHLVTLLYSPQVFLTLVQRHLGVEAAAAFGFLRSLYEQTSRYLPATLLFNLIRPTLVATYVGQGGIAGLSRSANMVGKVSLMALMPLLAVTAVSGEWLVDLASGGRFDHTGMLLAGFMGVLVPLSQRQLFESVAVATGQSRWCTLGAAAGILMLPLMLWAMQAGLGLWAAVAALAGGHLLFDAVVLLGVGRGAGFRPDVGAWLRLVAAAAVTVGALHVMSWTGVDPLLPDPAALWRALLAAALCLMLLWLWSPLRPDERAQLRTLVSRRRAAS